MSALTSGDNDSLTTAARAAAARRVSPADLVAFLPYACRQLRLDFNVSMRVRSQEEYVSRGAKPRPKPHRSSAAGSSLTAGGGAGGVPSVPDVDSEQFPFDREFACVPVTATLDAAGRVLELDVARAQVLRALLQVLALAAPFNPTLARLALRRCQLRGNIVVELAKPAFAALTDLCLDESPLVEANYATLLEGDRLRRLSLARLRLDDTVCAELAARLHYPLPAGRSLRVLDLGSNAVGDAGAAALAHALRTNRVLLHLNLAGNRVGDDGATELLRTLTPFRLTGYEVHESRLRLVAHLRSVRAAATAALREVAASRGRRTATPATTGRGGAPRRTSGGASFPYEAEERVTRAAPAPAPAPAVTSFEDPFSPSETVCIAGHVYCYGNRALCSLNLAHNHLTAVTAGRLARALDAQHVTRRTSLLRVVLEGNPLPAANESVHMAHVEELLERAVAASSRQEATQRRSTRARITR